MSPRTAESSAQRLHREAMRVTQRFGVVVAVWSTVLAAAAPDAAAPRTMWIGIAIVWVWALTSQALRPGYAWWAGWLAVASGLELLGPLAGTNGWSLAGGASFVVLAAAALTTRRSWVAATVIALSSVALGRDVIAADWNVGGGIGTVLIFAFGGLTITWLAEAIAVSLDERDALQERLAEAEAEAARSFERAESAARLHDTVLQDLTAVGRSVDLDEAQRHAGRASNQLRRFLRSRLTSPASLRSTIEDAVTAAADGAELSVGFVGGDGPVSEREQLVVDAVVEAVRNAAEHGRPPIRVFVEWPANGDLVAFIGDKGEGFSMEEVDEDRLGVRESIIGRLERAGGTATLRSGADGTEWELRLPPSN